MTLFLEKSALPVMLNSPSLTKMTGPVSDVSWTDPAVKFNVPPFTTIREFVKEGPASVRLPPSATVTVSAPTPVTVPLPVRVRAAPSGTTSGLSAVALTSLSIATVVSAPGVAWAAWETIVSHEGGSSALAIPLGASTTARETVRRLVTSLKTLRISSFRSQRKFLKLFDHLTFSPFSCVNSYIAVNCLRLTQPGLTSEQKDTLGVSTDFTAHPLATDPGHISKQAHDSPRHSSSRHVRIQAGR